MQDERTGSWIVFNGEVYNFREIRSELQARGIAFTSDGDTEVVLKAYLAWGPDALKRMLGMFGLAIWDEPKHRLFLARDRLGVKPLYYAVLDTQLVFGSELRSLMRSELINARLDSNSVAGYLSLGSVPEPSTMIDGVQLLPPGHWTYWDGTELELHEYWSLRQCFAEDHALPQRDLALHVKDLLEQSVQARLVSDAPIGVFLSGGVDSTAVTALAARYSSGLRTVSVVFDEVEFSESDYIRVVAERFGTAHSEVRLTASDLMSQIPAAVAAMDQPSFDGINTFVVANAARKDGLTVALSGVGADELFGGYASFRRGQVLDRWRRVLPPSGRRAAGAAAARVLPDTDRSRKLGRWLRDGADGDPIELVLRELFAPVERFDLAPELPAANHTDRWLLAGNDPFNRVSYTELTYYMGNVLLRDTDCMSMAVGLEVREPFLDHRLVELIASQPGRAKRGHSTKAVLKAALAGELPREVAARSKMGFTLPFSEWLRGPLRPVVEETLLDQHVGGQLAQVLEPRAVAANWDAFLKGRTTWNRPWALFTLKRWSNTWLPS